MLLNQLEKHFIRKVHVMVALLCVCAVTSACYCTPKQRPLTKIFPKETYENRLKQCSQLCFEAYSRICWVLIIISLKYFKIRQLNPRCYRAQTGLQINTCLCFRILEHVFENWDCIRTEEGCKGLGYKLSSCILMYCNESFQSYIVTLC